MSLALSPWVRPKLYLTFFNLLTYDLNVPNDLTIIFHGLDLAVE
jgi:hypothetical protein